MSVRYDADFYSLPSIYDILHTAGTAWEVDGLERMYHRFARSRSRDPVWFEPACGTGRYLRVAARRGHRVIGIDVSEAMIRYARRRFDRSGLGARARLSVGDMTELGPSTAPEKVDLAFNLINTIRHLPSDPAVLAHFECMAGVLRRGAVYAVGMSLSRYGAEFESEDVWEGARGSCRVKQTVQYLPPSTSAEMTARRERVVSHITVTRPRGVEHIESGYDLRTYDRRQWHRLIDRSALRLIAIVDEQGDEIPSPEMGYGIYLLAV